MGGLPVAVDAMGGDRAPAEIVAGARRAAEEDGLPVLLVGREDEIGDTGGLPVLHAGEVIGMDEDAGQGVRRKKDSSLVRAAEAVRDGRASAMVSAGNTGAAMASALLRMGRLPGVARPAIATPLPVPGSTPLVLLDAGANAECSAPWLVQFAQMGSVFSARRYGIGRPRVALLSIGEEPTKGTTLVKEAHALLADRDDIDFVGNVEGRDLMTGAADVVVTDGFTGNVALKTLEGGLRFLVGTITQALASTPEAREAAKVLLPVLAPIAAEMDPDSQGGAMLLGVDGVCTISHGSSSASAVANAIRTAHALATGGVVEELRRAVAAPSGRPAVSPAR
ncbi:MAG: phosphate acyltransferase PlsX [Acidimicrobiales bacterium]